EAAELFVEALQFNPTSDKSLGFAALGQLLLGEEEKAEKLALKAIEVNPESQLAYTTLISVWKKDNDFESKVDRIPEAVRKSASVSYQLGKKFQEIGKYEYAREYFEIAIDKSERKDADVKGALGTLILDHSLNPFLYVTGQLDEV